MRAPTSGYQADDTYAFLLFGGHTATHSLDRWRRYWRGTAKFATANTIFLRV